MIKKQLQIYGMRFKSVVDPHDQSNDYWAIATTNSVDGDNEIMLASGADLSYIQKNKKLFVDHKYDVDNVAGHIRAFKQYPSKEDHTGWSIRFKLLNNPIGNTCKAIIEGCGYMGLSVGAKAIDSGPLTSKERDMYDPLGKAKLIHRKWEWVETSLTAVPANVDSQTQKDMSKLFYHNIDDMLSNKSVTKEGLKQIGIEVPIKTKKIFIFT